MAAPLGDNDVPIKLGGRDLVLRATLEAAIAISRRDGGLIPVINKLSNLDFDTILFVCEQGLGQRAKELSKLIMEAGLSQVGPLCIQFVHYLSRGPKPAKGEDDEGEQKDPLAEGT